jgi:hypothetical protein
MYGEEESCKLGFRGETEKKHAGSQSVDGTILKFTWEIYYSQGLLRGIRLQHGG